MVTFDKIFYDFEVFKKDWMVVIINYETKERDVIINNVEKLQTYYDKNKENVWIGYNNRNYDQYILKGLLSGKNPYNISKGLIEEKIKGYKLVENAKNIQLYNFDLSNKLRRLKELEGFMGSKIKESSVDFTIQRKLTPVEIDEVIEYCIHDVEETINVYENSKQELESQVLMIDTFDLNMGLFDKTKAQLSSMVLDSEKPKHDRYDEFDLSFPDTLKLDKYSFVLDWYKNEKNRNYKKSLYCEISDVPHTLAWGGIHGAIPSYFGEGRYIMSDIASMYPAVMIEYEHLSRNVKDKEKYREIRDKRLVLKKAKDPRQAPLKIVLNSTYGAMKDKYNNLYDPLMANNVCVCGQLLLLDLIEKVEPYCELIQSNTDGILVKVNSKEDEEEYMKMCDEWCKRVRLDLEHDIYIKVMQKDVNNYIIVEEDGSYKSKGAYVKKLSNIDYDLPIVNDAVIKYFTEKIPIEETIFKCDDFIKFQKIVKITNNYNHCLHNNEMLPEKVFRVFSSTDESDGTIYKVKKEKNPEKIANTPDNCFIVNENVIGMTCPEKLDKLYYVGIANDRIEKFMNNDFKLDSGIKYVKYDSYKFFKENIIEFDNFILFYNNLIENKIGKKEIEVLIKLNYFEKFGEIGLLLKILDYFKIFKNKTIKKDKVPEELLMLMDLFAVFKKSPSKPSNDKYEKIDKIGLFEYVYNNFKIEDISDIEKVKMEFEFLGYVENIPNTLSVASVELISTKYKSVQLKSFRNGKGDWFKFKILPKINEVIIIRSIKNKIGYNGRMDKIVEKYEVL